MAAFFPELLDEFTTSHFLEKVSKKFHFDETQTTEIRAVAEAMLPRMRREAFWERKQLLLKDSCREWRCSSDAVYEKVAVSLGNGVDLLQENYSAGGMLLQSYMIEALSGELLMKGYDAYNRYVMEHTDRHVARYYFPGSENALPLELLPQLLKGLTRKIVCNTAFCMRPQKSVVFISELTQDETVCCKGICAGCGNTYCTNRIDIDHKCDIL